MSGPDPKVDVLAELRGAGWSVAVHNDYRLHSEPHTFWLFTHPCGRWIKGEGRTDADALRQVLDAARAEGLSLLVGEEELMASGGRASAHVAKATATDTHHSAGWVIFVRTTDDYEWSEWALEIRQSEADAGARVATLTAEVEAARELWPAFPDDVGADVDDDAVWANYDLAKVAAIASVKSYPGTLPDLDVRFYAVELPIRALSSGDECQQSEPQASASALATDAKNHD
jgi:hypothetical protein